MQASIICAFDRPRICNLAMQSQYRKTMQQLIIYRPNIQMQHCLLVMTSLQYNMKILQKPVYMLKFSCCFLKHVP